MAKDQGPLSGFRDLLSAQTIARERVVNIITSVYERYGFMPIKTPAIERFETLNGKYSDEAATLIYDFEDRGGRHLALRYDHTVPLARVMAASGQSLPSPYKRYVVGDVWRGESPQAGRYREFTQIDADIVGTDSYLADSELLAMMHDVFAALDIAVSIEVNDRRILDGLAEACGISGNDGFLKFVGTIDKVSKIGTDKVLLEIQSAFGDEAMGLVERYLSISVDNGLEEVLGLFSNQKATDGVNNLKSIFSALSSLSHSDIKFNPNIARGLNYYTSTIYETVANDLPALGSVCSGGRYDNLIKQLGGPDMPAIGTSIGLDRLMEAMNQLGKASDAVTKTLVFITNLDDSLNAERIALANELRSAGIATEIYYKEAKLGKQLEAASKLGVNKVIIYGQTEHNNSSVVLKDLSTSEQKELSRDKIIDELKPLISI